MKKYQPKYETPTREQAPNFYKLVDSINKTENPQKTADLLIAYLKMTRAGEMQ